MGVCLALTLVPSFTFAYSESHLQQLLQARECVNCDLTDIELAETDLNKAAFLENIKQ